MSDKLPDAANVVLAGFVVGQTISSEPFSLFLALVGVGAWVLLLMVAVAIAAGDEDR